jgi:ubiquinone/menaquinone biosynthesis C-methylase UbiE
MAHPDRNTLKKIWHTVPPDYYQKGTKNNLLQYLWHRNKLRAVKSLIDQPPRSILDVGCASGWFLSRLRAYFPKASCTGVDVYPQAIKFGKAAYPQIKFAVADAHRLPFKNRSFDTIVCTEVLEHVVNPLKVLREIRRVAAPQARIIIEMDSGNWLFNLVWSIWTNLRGRVWQEAHLQVFTAAKLKNLIIASGMQIETEKYFSLGMAVVFLCRP